MLLYLVHSSKEFFNLKRDISEIRKYARKKKKKENGNKICKH